MDTEFLMRDKLVLRGLMFHGFHGVLEEEKKLGQKFLVDIDAYLELQKAGDTDNLDDSVSYADIYNLAREVVEGPSFNLLESVATKIVKDIFASYRQISAVRVRVGKPHVAVKGPVEYLGVEIYRSRTNMK
ncbi:dihydroneopterin aldolase 1-like [Nymphaea colorata]|nr:dihydroneopterin aldolase 1-like [Nymphaea colorata]XP_031482193.1 dihydroneopterin aldolase 1-like [Nymphaea colorata]XP_049933625.1 dihydroneopterin aldolase 1-like [Nymphaea colorata]